MLPDRVSNPGPLTYESDVLPSLCASALVSLLDVQPPSVYKSHILNWPNWPLYLCDGQGAVRRAILSL